MISFYNSRKEIESKIRELLYFSYSSYSSNPNNYEFGRIEFEVPKVSFKKLLDIYNNDQILVWNNKDNIKTIFGVGSCITLYNDFKKILQVINQSPDLHFFCASRFDITKKISAEWKKFKDNIAILPQVEFISKSNSFHLRLNFISDIFSSTESIEDYIDKTISLIFDDYIIFNSSHEKESKPRPEIYNKSLIPQKKKWNKLINECTDQIEKNDISKVVIARKKIVTFNEKINYKKIAKKLFKEDKNSYYFLLKLEDSIFISITPECLFKTDNNKILIDSLAGTRAVTESTVENDKLKNELMNSPKEIEEHRIVSSQIVKNMHKICTKVEKVKDEEVLKLKYVQHIYSKFSGTLNNNIEFDNIINTIHPTPAVGGMPWNKARNYIKVMEPFDRGLYSAPVGYVSGNEYEFAVAIRSALIVKDTIHIFGGAGIVQDSVGEQEWIETETKMKNFLNII